MARGALALLLVAGDRGVADDGGTQRPERRPAPPSGPDLSGADLWLSFEDDEVGADGAPVYPDAPGGSSTAAVVTAERRRGRAASRAPAVTAAAVASRRLCADAAAARGPWWRCGRDPALDPGDRDFEFGATVWLAPDQTTTGSNIVQKGRFGTDGGQWKLQVDSDEGEPSCVVRGDAPRAEPVVVRSKVSISDSAWHRVVCRRDARRASASRSTASGPGGRCDRLGDQRARRSASAPRAWATGTTSSTAGSTTSTC